MSPTTSPDTGATTPLLSDDPRPAPEKLSIDDMLQKHCGEFGRWQLRHFVLTSLAWALEAFHTMVMIFADRQPPWRCVAPDGCAAAKAGPSGFCGLTPAAWEWAGGPGVSTVAEWGLVCGERYKVGLVQSLFFSGCMIGAGVFGHLSDSGLGRRGSLIVVCILNSLFGCLTAFSPSYPVYAVLRFLTGLNSGGVGLCCFVLATEPVGPARRGAAGMSTFYFFSSGIALLSAIAYAFPHSWRLLYLTSSLPSLVFVALVLPFVSESPRWCLVRGRLDQAMRIMRSIAEVNGRQLPRDVTLVLDNDPEKSGCSSSDLLRGLSWSFTHEPVKDDAREAKNVDHTDPSKGSVIDVVRSSITRKRLLLTVGINFLCSVVYYGLSLNVVNLDNNIYLNVTVNAAAEMPAFLATALMVDRFGRKPLTVGTLLFSGCFCLLGSVVSATWKPLKMACGVVGIFGMAATYNLLFIYAAELFPTVVRNAAMGCATQAAQMGAILAPFVVVFGGSWPFVVFAGCGFVAGGLGFCLPETLKRPLYDTMEGMEEGESERK